VSFGAKGLARSRREPPELVLTPFIDVMFVILIFLVLSTSFMVPTSLKLNLPESRTGQAAARGAGSPVEIEVSASGELRLSGEPVEPGALESRLKALDIKPGRAVLLAADRDAAHGRVVEVMDHLRRAGVTSFGIRTLSGRDAGAPPP